MRYSDSELEQLLDDIESERAERKESWAGDAPEKGRQAVCAFANDLSGSGRAGVLFVGARDDGTPRGLPITDQLLQTLADIKTDGSILPPPTLLVEKRIVKGAELAVVIVQPADAPPVRYKGRIWIRTGPRRGVASAQDERILNERRRHRDLPFDLHALPSASLASLNRTLFEEEYLPAAVAPDILAANERSYEQRLLASRMIASLEEPTPTVLGVLVLGRSPRDTLPGAYVQFLRIGGQTLADPVLDESVADGPLAQVMRRIDEKVDVHLKTAVDLTSGTTERRTVEYPRAALQQIIRNAVLHRTYEHTNAPVRIYWFSDRIEVHSPGGPFGLVNAGNFGQPGITDYRNPHVAEAMKVLGFVQRFGMGISIARDLLNKNGNPPPEFQVDQSRVLSIMRSRRMDRALVLQFDDEVDLPEPWRFAQVCRVPDAPWRELRQDLQNPEVWRRVVAAVDGAIAQVTHDLRGGLHLFGAMPYTVALLAGRRLDDLARRVPLHVHHLQEGRWALFSGPSAAAGGDEALYLKEERTAEAGADVLLAIEGVRAIGWNVLGPLAQAVGAGQVVRFQQRSAQRLVPPGETGRAAREIAALLSKMQSERPEAVVHLVATCPGALLLEVGRLLSPTVFRGAVMHEYAPESAGYVRTLDVVEVAREGLRGRL